MIEEWFQKPPGTLLLAMEKQQLQHMLEHQFGDMLVQLGGPCDGLFTHSSPIVHRVNIGEQVCSSHGVPYVRANYDELPLRQNSTDVIICMHVLEFMEQPEQLLEQIYHALVPNGQLIVISFNPKSWWRMNMQGKFYFQSTMKSMLKNIGYSIIARKSVCFRPPIKNETLWRRLLFMEPIGQFLLPSFGGVYFISARKKVVGVDPLPAKWWPKKVMINNGCAEPTTRNLL